MGADVVKIEDPFLGDYIRWMPPYYQGESAYHLMLNRNKRSVKLNLKLNEGKDLFLKLVKRVDIIIESFRPGVMDKLGLGYAKLSKIKPDLIYCAISGYGQSGPFMSRAGHDLNYIGFSGLLSKTKDTAECPVIPGIQIADLFGGGMMAVIGILSAMIYKNKAKEGQFIDISISDGVFTSQTISLASVLFGRKDSVFGMDNLLSGGIVCYNVYETSDERFITLAAIEEKFWHNFVKLIQKPEWTSHQYDPANKKDPSSIYMELQAIFKQKTLEDWECILGSQDTCFGPVLSHNEAISHDLFNQRGLIVEYKDSEYGSIPQVGFPIKFSKSSCKIRMRAPKFGEHTMEVLSDVGLTKELFDLYSKAQIV